MLSPPLRREILGLRACAGRLCAAGWRPRAWLCPPSRCPQKPLPTLVGPSCSEPPPPLFLAQRPGGHRPARAPEGICPAGKGQSLCCLSPSCQSTPNFRWGLLLVCSEECARQWLEVTLSESLGEAAKGHWHAQGPAGASTFSQAAGCRSEQGPQLSLSWALSSAYLLLCSFPCVEGEGVGGGGLHVPEPPQPSPRCDLASLSLTFTCFKNVFIDFIF